MTPSSGLVVLAPGLTDRVGHEHEYTLMVAEAAISRGAMVRVFCPPAGDLDLPGEIHAVLPPRRAPVRSRSLKSRILTRLAPIRERMDRRQYQRLFARGGSALWLLHTAPYGEIATITEAFRRAGQGRLALILRYDHYDDPAAIESVRRALAPAEDPRITLFADSEDLRNLLGEVSPAPIRLAPIPVQAVPRVERGRPVVGYFGAMRRQKGFHLLPALFACALAIDPTLSFFVQAYAHPDDTLDAEMSQALSALRAAPRTTVVETPLSSAQFQEAIVGCAALVTPYDTRVYRAGTSGIFAAGLAAGSAVVGASTGWMKQEALRAGLTRYFATDFTDAQTSAQILVEAVAQGARVFTPTASEGAWIAFNSAESLVERLFEPSGF